MPGRESSDDCAAATPPGLIEAEGDKPKVAPTRRYFSELRASLKNALDVTSDLEQVGAGEGSRPSLPVAPDSPLDYDPLEAAITVLSHVKIEEPSSRMDTEDAAMRVALALDYLRMVPRV